MHHFIIICEFKLELQSRNGSVGLWPLWPWPWPFAWTLIWSLVITPENFMMIPWWEHSQKGVTNRQTENTICRAAWSQLKTIGHLSYATSSFVHHFVPSGEFKLELQSVNAQSGSNSTIFRAVWPWNLTMTLNKANLRDLIAATGLVISNWIQIVNFSARVTVKFDGLPRKTIGYFFYSTSSFVHHFKSIGEFKLDLQSRNAQFGSKLVICYPEWPWNLMDDLENNRAPLLCYFKLCAALRSHWWIQTGVTVRKRPIWVKFDDF